MVAAADPKLKYALSHRDRWIMLFTLSILMILTGCARRYQVFNDGREHPAQSSNGICWGGGRTPDIHDHVIVVDGQGVPHDPLATNSDGPGLSMCEFRRQLAQMFETMRDWHKTHPGKKILIFVHGGLNAPSSSLQQADKEIQPIMAAGYYPIFLNWNSGIFETYGEHADRITQGLTDDSFVRKVLSPLYVVADAGRALSRAPIVWSNQIGNDVAAFDADMKALPRHADRPHAVEADEVDSERWANQRRGKGVAAAYQALLKAWKQDQKTLAPDGKRSQIRISIGPDLDVSAARMTDRGLMYALTSPMKFGTSWIIDSVGTPAWQNMMRRTLIAFDGQLAGNPGNTDFQLQADLSDSDVRKTETRERRTSHARNFSDTGAVEVFREKLLNIVEKLPSDTQPDTQPSNEYEVTLIAHSAGTMVLNEWLRRDIAEERNASYQQMVYMAAACSVRDFLRTVVPYLLKHQESQFYNLMLHPLADRRETGETHDAFVRGSLLVWLDGFLTDPATPLDRTLGRWDNIVPAAELIPTGVRGQITLKAFALAPYDVAPPPEGQPDYGPQVHGQFRGRPYWLPEFWESASPVIPSIQCMGGVWK